MRGKVSIGLDVDDVLAGFYPAMCEKYGKKLDQCDIWGEDVSRFISKHWHKVKLDPEFWKTLPVISSPESINFEFDYYISAFPPEMFEARQIWLKENGFPDKPLLCTSDKLSTCREYGVNVLVDDKGSTIEDVMCGGYILGIRFKPYYMIEDGQDIDDLSQVMKVIESYA